MKPYFCYLEYFATCEGLTYSMAMIGAKNEEEAKKKFVRKYMCDESLNKEHIRRGVEYFAPGVIAYELHEITHHDKIKEILKPFVTQAVIDSLFDAEKSHALHEFNFHIYTNYS